MSGYINRHVPPTARLLALAARVTFIAGREPSVGASGYLADPYGHLVYLGLQLDARGLGDLILAVIRREQNRYGSTVRARVVQADLLARFAETDLVVVHTNELWRLGTAARSLDARATDITEISGYLLYRIGP